MCEGKRVNEEGLVQSPKFKVQGWDRDAAGRVGGNIERGKLNRRERRKQRESLKDVKLS